MTTADQIISTATELVQKKGFNAFSYHDIAEEIGIKKASIHYHYPGKYDLGLMVMKNYRELHNSALENINKELKNPLKKLHAFGDLFSCTLNNDYRMCPCGMLTTDINTLPVTIKEEVKGFFKDSESWLTFVIKEGIEKQIFISTLNPKDTAKTLFASFEGAMLSARAFEDKNRLTKTIRQLINLLLK